MKLTVIMPDPIRSVQQTASAVCSTRALCNIHIAVGWVCLWCLPVMADASGEATFGHCAP